ncbi:MAG: FKBP-type peptidyl-prolyl cis-trans isomerase [Leifsonia sp.]|uniref:FKBP-type peptidyl-prolyl cis-trans isomerase n=1 Tax=Leifsonia sp. TaxID=1870902 RepID=UPI003F7CDEA9
MRRSLSLTTALIVTGLAVTGLAACSSSSPSASSSATATPAAATCQNTKPGSVSDSVKVTGAFHQEPKVAFATPLKVTDTERTVLITGTGEKAKPGATVGLALAAYDGTTGKALAAGEGFGTQPPVSATLDDKKYLPGFVRAAECLPIGSRSVVTATAEQAFGTAYSQLNLSKDAPVVLLADVVSIVPTKADGAPVAPTAGFPTVKLSKTGEPMVTIPKADPPKETRIAQLKKGSGETVLPGDTVTVQYKGVLWRNGQMFDSSWSRGAPTSFQTTQVVKGFQKALEGQTVGSQVIAIVPPADGYGSKGQGEIKGTDTMVFVVDILGTTR